MRTKKKLHYNNADFFKRNTFTYKRFCRAFCNLYSIKHKRQTNAYRSPYNASIRYLHIYKNVKLLPTRFELVSPDSESGVLTTTLWKQSSRSGVRTRACMSTMHLKCIPLDQLGHPTSFCSFYYILSKKL